MRKVNKVRFLGVRVEPSLHKAFIGAARRFGGPSVVMREMIHAFIEDRIQIHPSEKELYHVSRNKN